MFHLAIAFMFPSLKKHVSNHVDSEERHKGLAPMVNPMGNNRNFKKKMNCSLPSSEVTGESTITKAYNPKRANQYFLLKK